MLILLLTLLVVGPERLPEVARLIGKTLRDARKAYDNLTRDLGPELMSIQESTREIRESVESVRSIPKDTLSSVIRAAELDETMDELRDVEDRIRQVGKTMSDVQKMVREPLKTTTDVARAVLTGTGVAAADASGVETDESVPDPELVGQARPVHVGQEVARVVTDETALEAGDVEGEGAIGQAAAAEPAAERADE
ncbi:MAG: twin-arginine translocase TatA/TatE family subunit [Anaerolineae bacterium]|nr:twin-arginine translocase TatA/TatE family subunit [Anaerolineae bacterium]